MTISSSTRKAGPFTGNGTATTFPFTFKVFQASDLLVVRLNTSTFVESTLVLNTDYTVALNQNQSTNPGGSIVLGSVLAIGFTLTATSDIQNLQPTDLTNQGGFYPTVINDALDRATIQIQQLAEKVGRALTLPFSTSAVGSLPTPSASKLLGWNADGSGFQNYGPADNAALSAALADPSGTSLVGFSNSLAYPPGSLGYAVKNSIPANAADAAAARDQAIIAQAGAVSARDAALLSKGIYANTAYALSNGVTSINSLVGGSGGTNGSYAITFSGGSGFDAAGTFTVSGGAVTAVNITYSGTRYATAPTISFAACPGLSGASATAVISTNCPVTTYFSVPIAADPASLILYRVDAGPVATEITRYPSTTANANPRPTSLADAAKNRIVLPAGGVFLGGGAATTGAFKIKFPVGVSATNVVMDITIMDNYGLLKLQIAGFNNVGGWSYTKATVIGDHQFQPKPNIRWGKDGTSDCIWISELGVTYWAYPQVWIDQVLVGGAAAEVWASGWVISLVTAFDTVTAGPTAPGGIQNVRADSISDSAKNRVVLPGGGVYLGGGGATTGAIKIKFPVGVTAGNNVLDVTIMDNYGVLHLMIAGFNNTGGWNYTKATVSGDHNYQPQPSIRWGKDGTSDCVWISDLAVNYWAYPKVWINSVLVAEAGAESWASGWSISLVTAFDTVTAGPVVPTKGMASSNPTFTGTLNGGTVNFPFSAGGTHLGYQSGPVTPISGTYNTTVGYQAGAALTTGYNNAFGGLQTGAACTTGYGNSGWGLQVLQSLTTGAFNSGYGIHALIGLTTGIANTAIGGGCMEFISTGGSNTAIGMYAGRDVGTGSGNVFIGNRSGQGNYNISNKLFIANNEVTTLIGGDFLANRAWVGNATDDGFNTWQVEGPIRFKPSSSSTPQNNGDLTFEATSNTSLKIKFKGSDGVVRSATLALS